MADWGRKAYALLAFLTLLNALNFIDRQLVPSLAPLLIEELGLTKAQIGLLYGFAFVLFYAVCGLFMGGVADRSHRPRLIAAGLLLWSLMTALSGAATGFLHLALARIFVGIGEAVLTPAAMTMLSDVFPEKRRALASGIYYAGVPLGVGGGFLISGAVAPEFGWRTCFYALGIAGVIVAPVLFAVPNPRRLQPSATPVKGKQIAALMWSALRERPELGWTILYAVLVTYANTSTIHVMTWLVEERGFAFERAADLSGAIYLCAGLLGVVVGGWAADWCHARWPGGRLWFLVVKGLVLLPATLAFYWLPGSSPWFYVCWFLSNFHAATWYGAVFASVQDFAPVQARATAVAVLLLAMNLLGVGLGPWITGAVSDRGSSTEALLIAAAIGGFAVVPAYLAVRRTTSVV